MSPIHMHSPQERKSSEKRLAMRGTQYAAFNAPSKETNAKLRAELEALQREALDMKTPSATVRASIEPTPDMTPGAKQQRQTANQEARQTHVAQRMDFAEEEEKFAKPGDALEEAQLDALNQFNFTEGER